MAGEKERTVHFERFNVFVIKTLLIVCKHSQINQLVEDSLDYKLKIITSIQIKISYRKESTY